MCDQSVFEIFHSELVNYVIQNNETQLKNTSKTHGEDLSNLEYIGFSTGFRIIERLTRELPRFRDELDTMKFICTDFWSAIYMKQIDNLRTNHQGIYVLQDNCFRYLSKLSNTKQYLDLSPRYVTFTCGLLRGSLANLGIRSIVTAEVQTMPSCKFHIQVQRN
ncbi:hypothetical protein WA026_004926 [Henosepilachna vigintioctopunctata]|uniref:Trafficking protein particle complex subunit 6B n=1 Tax=Henosepilachna vigintioctopunctata TaxID=420089 RepID=A0AAW1UK46_9CUCU